MISRVYYCFRLSRVSYSFYCNKLSVHNISPPLDWKFSLLLTLLVHYFLTHHIITVRDYYALVHCNEL